MDIDEFNRLVAETNMRPGKGMDAAKMFYVEGCENIAQCAKKFDVNRSTARRAIERIGDVINKQ